MWRTRSGLDDFYSHVCPECHLLTGWRTETEAIRKGMWHPGREPEWYEPGDNGTCRCDLDSTSADASVEDPEVLDD